MTVDVIADMEDALRKVSKVPMPKVANLPPPAQSYAPPEFRIDPVLEGLFTHLPWPGEAWPEEKRKLWLSLVENAFKLIYKEEDDGKR
jgi:hypothetical protein